MSKLCSKCKEILDESCFSKRSDAKDGLQNQCKACAKQYNKQYHQDNREQHLAYNKQWRQDNREQHLAYNKQWYEAHKEAAKPSVYHILIGEEVYIGSTVWPYHRESEHRSDCSCGRHRNPNVQALYDEGHTLTFEVLYEFETLEEARELECKILSGNIDVLLNERTW